MSQSMRRQVESLRCFLRGAGLVCELMPRPHKHHLPSNRRAIAEDWKVVGADFMSIIQSYGEQSDAQ